MTTAELCALMSDLDRARFTLEDAMREHSESQTQEMAPSASREWAFGANSADSWVVYLCEHRTDLTYRVADYAAYRQFYAYLPTAWIVHQPRMRRSGRDEIPHVAALTPADIQQILIKGDGLRCRVESFHVRYDEHDDDRYLATVRLLDETSQDVATFAAYEALCQSAQASPEAGAIV